MSKKSLSETHSAFSTALGRTMCELPGEQQEHGKE